MSDSLQSHGLQLTWLLCPWDSPGKNTGVSCHALLQGIFLIQRLNLCLLHCRQILYQLSYEGSPRELIHILKLFTLFIELYTFLICMLFYMYILHHEKRRNKFTQKVTRTRDFSTIFTKPLVGHFLRGMPWFQPKGGCLFVCQLEEESTKLVLKFYRQRVKIMWPFCGHQFSCQQELSQKYKKKHVGGMKYHLLYPCHAAFGTYIIGVALSPKTYVNPWKIVC